MNKKIKVSVVLPFKDSAENLKNLLKHLSEQDELPNEIIIINASNKDIDSIFIKFKKFFKITIKDYFNYNNKIKAYPGQNRNLGVKFASNDLIFFIDSKTLPKKDWIKNTKEEMIKNNFELILGTTKYYASTFFQNIIHDLSYGNISYESVPGTAILKKSFHKSGEFYIKDAVFSFDTSNNISYKYFVKDSQLKDIQQLGNNTCNFIHKFIFYGIIILISFMSLCYLYYIRKHCHCNYKNKNENNNS